MIEKAVEMRPRDGYIVDSLGWAHYRLGRFDEAVEALERATDLRPRDATINDHLGDAYWRVGRKLEATYQWNQVLGMTGQDTKPEDVRAKLKAADTAGVEPLIADSRDDGYHLLDSIVTFAQSIHASDTIIVSHAMKDGFNIDGPFADALNEAPEENLVVKARDYVRKVAIGMNLSAPGVHISLKKRLPIASGIGGGSADAAAAVKALKKLWGIEPNCEQLSSEILTSVLGADVPMCMAGIPLRATNIGDDVTALSDIPALHLVIINCGEPISTPKAFSRKRKKDNAPIGNIQTGKEFVVWLRDQTRNDLYAPATKLCPALADCLDVLDAAGSKMSRMSGSGATCFGVFPSAVSAANAAREIAKLSQRGGL
ncbi:4-diphosphocytidyl-2-C-methyl-D-erythritol kinase [Nymphon striatum]|nr:4-diphosphocytidyl-2-C-methyl-D-erythritol kinase [Nymphon striatum]